MVDQHWTFISVAYGLTALALLAEWVLLRAARRRTLARVGQELELDDESADAQLAHTGSPTASPHHS